MPKIPFTVSARTAKLIGQENFANAEGAIIELVKNAYDADANNCIIIFDNSVTSNASIYVIDNGIGMTEDIIYDSWMTIGTNNKETNHTSIATGRIRTGAKGIGRFALDRLGSQSTIYTFPEKKEKNHFIWKVEWNKFNVNNAKIHEVKANIRNIRNISPVSILSKKFSQYEHINKHIKLLDKRKWNKGTILKIEKIKDNWTTEDLDNLYKNLEVLTPPIEQKSDFQIHLFCTEDVYKEKYGEIEAVAYDDYDYKMSFKYLANENKEVEVKIFRNELNIKELIDNYSEVFSHDELQNIRYNKDSFYKDVIEFTTSLSSFKKLEGTSQVLFDQLGEFDFTFYYIKNLEPNKEDKLVYPYKSFNTSFRKTWLEKYSGIKIFRDGFRVRPYGENGNDWLNLGERQAQSPAGAGQRKGGFRIRPNQISGTIHISRLKNKSFEDKSGREGLQENESFKLFKNILLELIKIFEKDRNIIMYNLSQLQKNKEEEIKKIAREEAEKIEKEQELRERKEQKSQQDNQSNNADNDKQNNRDEIFAKATVTYEKELRDKNEEIRILRSLASVGLTVSSFAHEVKNLRARLVPRNDHLKSQLSKFLKQEDLINIRKEENPFYMIDLNYQEDLKLKHWLDYSLNSIKKDKRKRVNINIHTYFDSFEVTWKKALEKRQINLEILGKYDKTYVIQGFEVDLDVIFNNLLSNAINAFKEIKGKVTKKIIINWVKKEKNIEILFSDNGIGLSDEYKESPYDIFNLFETSKRDNHGNAIGTGLGLYLLKMIIAEYKNANFELVNNNDNLGFCVKISIPSI